MRSSAKDKDFIVRNYANYISNVCQNLTSSFSDPQDNKKNITIDISFVIDDYVMKYDDVSLIPTYAHKLFFSPLFYGYTAVFNNHLEDRLYPFRVGSTGAIEVEENITFSQDITKYAST